MSNTFMTVDSYLALTGKVSHTFTTIRHGVEVDVTFSWSFDGRTLYTTATDAGTVFVASVPYGENQAAQYLLRLGYEVEQSVWRNLRTARWLHWEVVSGRPHHGLTKERAG